MVGSWGAGQEQNFADEIFKPLEFKELRDAFAENMYWKEGAYTFEAKLCESRLKSPYTFKFQMVLSSSDIERLRANCKNFEPAFRAMIKTGADENVAAPNWNWVNQEVKRL